jgi:cell division protein FtsL
VEDLFLILAVIFAVAMLILMIKYAKFIHSQPRIDAERRKIKEEESANNKNNSNDN